MPGGLTNSSDIDRAESIQRSFCSNNMTRGEAQRRLTAISPSINVSYWLTCDPVTYPQIPPNHVYVPPIGPEQSPGDFDGDGIPNEQDPDHYYPDENGDGIPDFEQDFGFKPHYMYDCKTGQQYFARTLTDHNNYTALGYVHDMSECDMNGGGGGNGNGMEVEGGILNTAGIFVVGAAKGTLIATIPILSMAVAVGFMKRIVRMGTGVGQ